MAVFTVCVLEPCCELTEPGYEPGPRPVGNRTPGGWPPRCTHAARRVATLTRHTDRDAAETEYAKTKGWYSTDGWMFEGEMPPEGERFRIMPMDGTLNTHYEHRAPVDIPFPTIDMARDYAEDWHEWPDGERHKETLFNIVGDTDTRVRWSSYGVRVGAELEAGNYA